jgi:molybdopterin-binding protein
MDDAVPIGSVARALGVSVDTLRRWERDGTVQFIRRGNRRYLPADELVRLVHARGHAPTTTSARNHLVGVVVKVERDAIVATVELACGPYRIVSLITAEALEDLALQPGDRAIAVVKASNVVIERD